MQRFFIAPEQVSNGRISFTVEQAHHIKKVLRLNRDSRMVVIDNAGQEMIARLDTVNSEKVEGILEQCVQSLREPSIKITLYQALLKSGKFEYVIQKCTEIGVSSFVPIICERCVAQMPGNSKLQRWAKTAQQAAEQSGRQKIPVVNTPVKYSKACSELNGFSVLPWENEGSQDIKHLLRWMEKPKRINIFIGPEGGFDPDEISIAIDHGIHCVSLGKRILRSETAGIVTASILMYEFDEMQL